MPSSSSSKPLVPKVYLPTRLGVHPRLADMEHVLEIEFASWRYDWATVYEENRMALPKPFWERWYA